MSSDPDLVDIAWLAAEIGATPVAVVALDGGSPPDFDVAARVGAGHEAAASAAGLAAAVVRHEAALVVPDLIADPRFSGDPATAPPLQARALAGVPLFRGGAILVLDLEPRPFLPWQVRALERLARLGGRRLEEAQEGRARDRRREQMFGALAGGLALEIQALQRETGEAAPRAAALARDLLALCGHRSLRPAAVDLNALVAERAARAAEECGRRLEVRLDARIGPVAADGERLGRAIAGLVTRAAGDTVRLATAEVAVTAGPPSRLPAGRYVLLTIGAAVPEDGDPLRGWSFESGSAGDEGETRGMLRQSGARLGTAIDPSGLPSFCIALPRAAD
jgi:GAF domain-containing protein